MQSSVMLYLTEHHSQSLDGSVSLQDELILEVGISQDRGWSQSLFEFLKHMFSLMSPLEWYIFKCEVVERLGYFSKVWDESSVVGGEPKESSCLLNCLWVREVLYSFNKTGIGLQAILENNMAQVLLQLLSHKFGLWQFEPQAYFHDPLNDNLKVM